VKCAALEQRFYRYCTQARVAPYSEGNNGQKGGGSPALRRRQLLRVRATYSRAVPTMSVYGPVQATSLTGTDKQIEKLAHFILEDSKLTGILVSD
jgi:hypothetical protein